MIGRVGNRFIKKDVGIKANGVEENIETNGSKQEERKVWHMAIMGIAYDEPGEMKLAYATSHSFHNMILYHT